MDKALWRWAVDLKGSSGVDYLVRLCGGALVAAFALVMVVTPVSAGEPLGTDANPAALGSTGYNFDFGPPSSPRRSNWTGVSPSSGGIISWSGAPVASVDRGPGSGANLINQDLVYGAGQTNLDIEVLNGTWRVIMNMGDTVTARENMRVAVEGDVIVEDLDTAAGQFAYVGPDPAGGPQSFEVTVTDGSLSFEIFDGGGANPHWVLTRLSLQWLGAGPAPAPNVDPNALVVNSAGDEPDVIGSDQQCRTAAQTCTLRAAIAQANYNPGADVIRFNIPGEGPHIIRLGSALPVINDARGGVTIDGYSQPGAQVNTSQTVFNAVIKIQLVLQAIDDGGFIIESPENTIRGLAITTPNEASLKIRIRGENADGNKIVGNVIGTNAAGTYSPGGRSGTGISLDLGPDRNQIGTPDLADRNVISGNGRYGLRINHGETSENLVQNNIVGLSPDGQGRHFQAIGIDLQWWTWGNYIGGIGQNERNVVSGNYTGHPSGAIDLSHMAVNNAVIGNFIGTTVDGNSANESTRNNFGIMLKDDPTENVIAHNVIGNSMRDGIWGRHNFSGRNYIVDNRIGVGVNGGDIGNDGWGVVITGHDNVLHGNLIANSDAIYVSNHNEGNGNSPPQQTVRNQVRSATFFNVDPLVVGFGANTHPDRSTPEVTAAGPSQVDGGSACAGCLVELYTTGRLNNDGSITPGAGDDGLVAIGFATADGAGEWSLRSDTIVPGRAVRAIATTELGEVGAFSEPVVVSTSAAGLRPNAPGPVPGPARPAVPAPPAAHQGSSFVCTYAGGTLSWQDAGAVEYYVFAVVDGQERYLGGHQALTLGVVPADGYRVEHWLTGVAVNASCAGPGAPEPVVFSCSVADGVLSWEDAGAVEYYVFATTDGVERYLGGHQALILGVAPADGYRVEHWLTGVAVNASCEGAGVIAFACAVADGVLSWADAGVAEYYVFATTDGVERYLGGHRALTLAVAPADSYRVEHWAAGQTNAFCS